MDTTEYQLLKDINLGKQMRRTLEILFLLTFSEACTLTYQSPEYSFASSEPSLKANN